MKSIQEHLRKLLQAVSEMRSLAVLRKAQINQVKDAGQKFTLHRPNSIIVRPVKRDWAVLSKDTPVDISI